MDVRLAQRLRLAGLLTAIALGLMGAYGFRQALAAGGTFLTIVFGLLTVLALGTVVLALPNVLSSDGVGTASSEGGRRGDLAASLEILRYSWGVGLCGTVAVIVAAPHSPATGVLTMGAFVLVGGVVGFLFGIPRTSGSELAPLDGPVGPNRSAAASGTASPARADVGYRLRPNTNLEQISDWLTKIIVGVGLVEMKRIPGALSDLTRWLALGLGATASKPEQVPAVQPFVFATVVYALTFGFLTSYLLTRLQLQSAFADADRATMMATGPVERTVEEMPLRADKRAMPRLTPAQEAATQQLVRRSPDSLQTPPDLAAWAKAKLTVGDLEGASMGYERALQLAPNDPKILGEYSIVLYRKSPDDPQNRREVLRVLERARDAVVADTPPEVVHRIFVDLTFHALYLPPPEGYTRAIAYGTDYNGRRRKLASGEVWLNLACAWAQKYADPSALEKGESQGRAFDALHTALALDPALTERARQLLGIGIGEEDADQDLRPFQTDPEFRQLVGLATA